MAQYSDIDIELTRQTDGDIQKDEDINAIVNSLNNIVATLQGSRRMLPEFATDLWNLLFEPLDVETGRMIGERMVEAIQLWDDRVDIDRVDITPDFDNNLYRARITFLVKAIRESISIDFILFTL